MNGAYGERPELRPPGIKASLRFWWRALHGHLSIADLRQEEGRIFGNTKGRSKVIIRIEAPIDENKKAKTSLLPHKGGSKAASYTAGEYFKIRVDCDKNIISEEKMKNLFIIACTLGGWGKRSRRGFGSITVMEIDDETYQSPVNLKEIHSCMEQVVGPNRFSILLTTNKIEAKNVDKSNSEEYPRILSIELGSSTRTLTEIGKATHDTKFTDDQSNNRQDYSKSLGDGKPRFASPIYISALSNGLPVITTLKKQSWVSKDLQIKLKNRII